MLRRGNRRCRLASIGSHHRGAMDNYEPLAPPPPQVGGPIPVPPPQVSTPRDPHDPARARKRAEFLFSGLVIIALGAWMVFFHIPSRNGPQIQSEYEAKLVATGAKFFDGQFVSSTVEAIQIDEEYRSRVARKIFYREPHVQWMYILGVLVMLIGAAAAVRGVTGHTRRSAGAMVASVFGMLIVAGAAIVSLGVEFLQVDNGTIRLAGLRVSSDDERRTPPPAASSNSTGGSSNATAGSSNSVRNPFDFNSTTTTNNAPPPPPPNDPTAEVVCDKEVEVSAGGHGGITFTLARRANLRVVVTPVRDAAKGFSVYVMEEAEYANFTARREFVHFPALGGKDVAAIDANGAVAAGPYCVVIQNSENLMFSMRVHVRITAK